MQDGAKNNLDHVSMEYLYAFIGNAYQSNIAYLLQITNATDGPNEWRSLKGKLFGKK